MADDTSTCCPHHPAIQLRRRHRSTGEWKIILPSCPLCVSGLPGSSSSSSLSNVNNNNTGVVNDTSLKAELFEHRGRSIASGHVDSISSSVSNNRASSAARTRASLSFTRSTDDDDDNLSMGSIHSTRSDARIVLNSTNNRSASRSGSRHRRSNNKRWSNTSDSSCSDYEGHSDYSNCETEDDNDTDDDTHSVRSLSRLSSYAGKSSRHQFHRSSRPRDQ